MKTGLAVKEGEGVQIGPPEFTEQASGTARTRKMQTTRLELSQRETTRTRVALTAGGCNSCTLSDAGCGHLFAFYARNLLLALADLFLEPILMIKSLKD